MKKSKLLTFNQFCHKICDRLYEPRLPEEAQSTGYKELKKMVVEDIKPATLEETTRWLMSPTSNELISVPDIKYLRFLHPNLRSYIIDNWELIRLMEIE